MAEKEYIDRQAAIEAFDDPGVERNYGDVDPESVIRVIERIPSADVRPVVMCWDCKYAPIEGKDGSDLEWPFNEFDENPCPYKCLDNWYSHKPASDFFCAAGEKREKS